MNKKDSLLLPCPFCGSKARIVFSQPFYYVRCTGCKIRTFGSIFIEQEAIDTWNHRTTPIAKVKVNCHPCGVSGICQHCQNEVYNEEPYCSHCGYKLDWSSK